MVKLKQILKDMRYLNVEPQVSYVPVKEETQSNSHPIEFTANLSELTNQIRDMSNKFSNFMESHEDVEPQTSETTTELSTEEVEEVMGAFESFQKKYFKDNILLTNEMVQNFIFNIPREVYNAHCEAHNDILDPLILMYGLLTEDPAYTMGAYLQILLNEINNNKADIDDDAADYYKLLVE